MFFRHSISFLAAFSLGMSSALAAVQPRIVNIVNFVRQNDFMVENSEALLYEATEKEFELSRKYSLPSTFLLQYDALLDPKYQALFKDAGPDIEVGAWLEITQPQAEAAGLEWNLPHPWYPYSTKDFGIGYTQEERARLVDGLQWSSKDHVAGLRFVQLESGGRSADILFSEPSVTEAGREKLNMTCTAADGSIFRILFGEKDIQVSSDSNLAWALELTVANGIAPLPFKYLALDSVNAEYNGVRYAVEVAKGQVEKPSKASAFVLRLHPEQNLLRIKLQQ